MAGNYNINTPDGTISVPAWAKEETLQKLLNEVRQNRTVSQEVEQAVRQVGLDTADFEKALEMLKRHINEKSEAEKRASKKVKETLQQTGKRVAGHLQNTEKPLTAMTGILGSLGEAAGGLAGGFLKGSKFADKFAKAIGTAGDVGAVAATTFMTWLGWNAGKMEMFAEVQQSMIDSGAIMFDNKDTFTTLYRVVQNNGVTYTQLSNVVSNFGYGIAGLGKDVSSGTLAFTKLIKGDDGILAASDKFGDWGLSHDQLMNVYANYIETQVKSGFINNNLDAVKDDLNMSFNDLMAQTTALAGLTGKSRTEMLQKMMQSAGDVRQSVTISEIRKNFPDIAKNVEETMRTFDVMETLVADDPQAVQQLQAARQALLLELGNNALDPSDININSALVGIDPALAAVFQQSGFTDMLNSLGAGARIGVDEMVAFFDQKNFKGMRQHYKDLGSNTGAFGSVVNTAFMMETDLGIRLRDYQEKIGAGLDEYSEDVKKKVKYPGQSTVAMNEMTKSFLQAQEAITLDLQSLSTDVLDYSKMLADATAWLQNTIHGNEDDDEVGGERPDDRSPEKKTRDDWWEKQLLPALRGVEGVTPEQRKLAQEIKDKMDFLIQESGGALTYDDVIDIVIEEFPPLEIKVEPNAQPIKPVEVEIGGQIYDNAEDMQTRITEIEELLLKIEDTAVESEQVTDEVVLNMELELEDLRKAVVKMKTEVHATPDSVESVRKMLLDKFKALPVVMSQTDIERIIDESISNVDPDMTPMEIYAVVSDRIDNKINPLLEGLDENSGMLAEALNEILNSSPGNMNLSQLAELYGGGQPTQITIDESSIDKIVQKKIQEYENNNDTSGVDMAALEAQLKENIMSVLNQSTLTPSDIEAILQEKMESQRQMQNPVPVNISVDTKGFENPLDSAGANLLPSIEVKSENSIEDDYAERIRQKIEYVEGQIDSLQSMKEGVILNQKNERIKAATVKKLNDRMKKYDNELSILRIAAEDKNVDVNNSSLITPEEVRQLIHSGVSMETLDFLSKSITGPRFEHKRQVVQDDEPISTKDFAIMLSNVANTQAGSEIQKYFNELRSSNDADPVLNTVLKFGTDALDDAGIEDIEIVDKFIKALPRDKKVDIDEDEYKDAQAQRPMDRSEQERLLSETFLNTLTAYEDAKKINPHLDMNRQEFNSSIRRVYKSIDLEDNNEDDVINISDMQEEYDVSPEQFEQATRQLLEIARKLKTLANEEEQ